LPEYEKCRVLLDPTSYAYAHYQVVIDRAGKPIDYIYLKVNQAYEELMNLPRGKLIGRRVTEVFPGIEKSTFDWIGTYSKVAHNGGSISFEQFSERLDLYYEVIACGEKPGYFSVIYRDITAKKKKEKTLRDSEQHFRSLVGNLQGGIVVEDEKGNIILTNQAFCEIFGISAPPEALVGSNCSQAAEEVKGLLAEPELFPRRIKELIENRQVVIGEEIKFADGRVLERDYIPVFSETNRFIGHMWQYRDITGRKQMEKDLYHYSQLQKLLMDLLSRFINIPLEDIDEGINIALREMGKFVGADRVYIFEYDFPNGVCNNTYEWCAPGITPQISKLQGVSLDIIPDWVASHVKGEAVDIPDVEAMEPGVVKELMILQEIKSLFTIPMKGETGCLGFVGFDAVRCKQRFSEEERKLLNVFAQMLTNVNLHRQTEERIRYMSFHDSLTGLYNRAYLEKETERVDTKRQLPLSIVIADLNGLKLINDTYGHETGDQLLKTAADILRSACRTEDIIARWGGDEFTILLPQTKAADAETLKDRVAAICKETFVEDIPISMAIGLATKTEPTTAIAEVLKEAEDSMYKQKLAEKRGKKSGMLKTLIKTLAGKSFETENHIQRMRKVTQLIGKNMNLSKSELSRLDIAVFLHDIGMVNLDQEILTKKEPLTVEEWNMIKKHPEIGFRIASSHEEFAHVTEDVLAHHEHWDGTGYPQGLRGEEIPLFARIIAVADAFEVMYSGRPYREALNIDEIKEELNSCVGKKFDPKITEILLKLISKRDQ